MDGTLLTSKGLITPAVADALRAVASSGTRVIVATGKARPGALKALAPSGLSAYNTGLCTVQTPGVFLNGVLVYGSGGAAVHARTLDNRAAADALALASEAGVPAVAFLGDEAVTLSRHALVTALHTRFHEPLASHVSSLDALLAGPPVVKVLLYAEKEEHIEELRPRFEELLSGRATIVQAVPDMLEVLPLHASKGDGVQRLLSSLGVPRERAAAVGDGENDVGMLRAVGLGLAMANAVPVARAAAVHVLRGSNDSDGVAEAVERFLL